MTMTRNTWHVVRSESVWITKSSVSSKKKSSAWSRMSHMLHTFNGTVIIKVLSRIADSAAWFLVRKHIIKIYSFSSIERRKLLNQSNRNFCSARFCGFFEGCFIKNCKLRKKHFILKFQKLERVDLHLLKHLTTVLWSLKSIIVSSRREKIFWRFYSISSQNLILVHNNAYFIVFNAHRSHRSNPNQLFFSLWFFYEMNESTTDQDARPTKYQSKNDLFSKKPIEKKTENWPGTPENKKKPKRLNLHNSLTHDTLITPQVFS